MTRDGNSRDERGAVALSLAVGVMLMVGLLAAGLLSSVATSLGARSQLDTVRNRQYAADAAIEYAIAQVRANPGPGPTICQQSGAFSPAPQPINGIAIAVYCANNPRGTFSNGFIYLQRNVVFRACLAGGSCDPENIDANTIIRAQVNFEKTDDVSPVSRTYIQSWSVNR